MTYAPDSGDGTTGEEWILDDGRRAIIRPIRAGDGAALVRFHEGLSSPTVYYRYFAPHPHLTPHDVEHFTVVDHHAREALVVQAGAEILAVARFDRVAPDLAEVAFVVADEWQGCGIGGRLMDCLIERARAEGIRSLVADMLPGNTRMLKLMGHGGRPSIVTHDPGVVHVAIDITAI